MSVSVALTTVRDKIPLRASFRIEYLHPSVNSLPSFRHLSTPDELVFHLQLTEYCAARLYLIRGRGVVNVEQVNWMSSPSSRQALSRRLRNLGGAAGMRMFSEMCGMIVLGGWMSCLAMV